MLIFLNSRFRHDKGDTMLHFFGDGDRFVNSKAYGATVKLMDLGLPILCLVSSVLKNLQYF